MDEGHSDKLIVGKFRLLGVWLDKIGERPLHIHGWFVVHIVVSPDHIQPCGYCK